MLEVQAASPACMVQIDMLEVQAASPACMIQIGMLEVQAAPLAFMIQIGMLEVQAASPACMVQIGMLEVQAASPACMIQIGMLEVQAASPACMVQIGMLEVQAASPACMVQIGMLEVQAASPACMVQVGMLEVQAASPACMVQIGMLEVQAASPACMIQIGMLEVQAASPACMIQIGMLEVQAASPACMIQIGMLEVQAASPACMIQIGMLEVQAASPACMIQIGMLEEALVQGGIAALVSAGVAGGLYALTWKHSHTFRHGLSVSARTAITVLPIFAAQVRYPALALGATRRYPPALRRGHAMVSPDAATYSKRARSIGCQAQSDEIKLYLRSGWNSGFAHGAAGAEAWSDYPLKKVPASSGKWLSGIIPLPAGSNGFEFVIASHDKNEWNKPDSGNYFIPGAGAYTLEGGLVKKVEGKPVMVVSDLDGTMVGDDSATAEFKTFWEDTAMQRGGMLVYNTGRALDSFLVLMNEKRHCMAHPDALISAVGTKWDIEVVCEAGYKALDTLGKESMHFRPASEMNEHKITPFVPDHTLAPAQITLGVNVAVLDRAVASFEEDLAKANVKANIITISMENGGENPAIVVGNAQPDLVKWVEERRKIEPPSSDGTPQRLFVAQGFEARGILEGLAHMGFF
eukprot:gene16678-22937_t